MNGLPVKPLLVFSVLLAVAGCNQQPPPAAAPAQPAAQPTRPIAHDASLHVGDHGNRKEVRTAALQTGSVVTWNYSKQFYVEFTDDNPCNPPADISHPNDYPSSGSGSAYTVQCTLAGTGKSPFPYEIHEGAISAAAQKKLDKHHQEDMGSHCEGCVIETQ